MGEKRSRTQRHRTPSSGKYDARLPLENKKQILGFFLLLCSFLILLSIVSYSDVDQSKVESINILDIFRKENVSAPVSNWLGIAGVMISYFFVRNTFGYFSIIIPVIIGLFGFNLLRKKILSPVLTISVYLMILMILASSLFGLLKISFGDSISYSWIGVSGDYFSSLTHQFIGSLGGYIMLSGLIIIIGFLTIDRDLARSLARFRGIIDNLLQRYRAAREDMKQKREEERTLIKSKNLLETERAKIIKSKHTETEEAVIKETNINRPPENELVSETLPVETPVKEKEIDLVGEKAGEEKEEIEEEFEAEGVIPVKKKPVHEASREPEESYVPEELSDYRLPPIDLLDEPLKDELDVISDEELKENGRLLQAKLLNFDVKIEKVIATPGPVVTLYELVPAEDVKLSRIESLQDDIALAMKARGIRMIIPIPGKGTVGVEIPNHKSAIVKIRSVIGSKKFNDSTYQLPLALGKTISGEVYVDDLAKMPHFLIAGSTGSGKSVGINTIITSLIYKLHPSDLKFVLIDPKKIELNQYSKLKHHYLAVSKDFAENIVTTPQNSVLALKALELEMEKRYERLANATVRNIQDYNKKFAEGRLKDDENIKHSKMPYIIVIIDELADLMLTASREVEDPIARLAQLARAVGIHLVLATQRPSVDVITGVIKANFSARVAYLVNSKVDSRTILDMNGAEQLLGQGDMLYLPPGIAKPIRIQSPFISADEVDRLTDFIQSQKGFSRPYELPSVNAAKKKSLTGDGERDELFEEAARLIVRYQQGSVSLLQRKLKVGYARAARIVDELEEAGIVGPFDGSKAREVLVENEQELENYL
jgi:S-DNA-T family DNA segregation ATPase FtsK/SpoIIIE